MLIQALDKFQVAKREHKENVKAQYTDKKGISGAKEYFRASELGSGDRKILYGFFAHQLPKKGKSARNLRQLENGDFVHDRYQSAWEEMGVLLSMEERLSSRNDEYLKQFPWEWAGHYDGLLDLNLLKAHAEGLVTVSSVFNEDTEKYELQVEVDDEYAASIGIFDEDGNISESYSPPTLVADIKTMNPWGFKRIKEKGDVSDIGGYIDQISFYMYMLNTPYGSIYLENKENNDVVEVQIVWTDMHDGMTYGFLPAIHGEKTGDQVRVTIDTGRFFGDDTREGCVPRLNRLWGLREALKAAYEAGDTEVTRQIFSDNIPRCSDDPKGFPCSWGHRSGKPEYCEYFDHCWSAKHGGAAVSPWEEVPAEAVWEFANDSDATVRVDSRKVPQGITYEGFIQLVEMGVLDFTKFVIPDDIASEVSIEEEADHAVDAGHLFGANGELNLNQVPTEEATEYVTSEGKKAVKCVNCHRELTYTRLGNGGTKKCDFCNHTNKVVKS